MLFDGGCFFCRREVAFLRRRDRHGRIFFVDINSADYEPAAYAGISYRQAMGRMHALQPNGELVSDLAVFREAYQLIGLGWLYAPTSWPLLAPLADRVYQFWAHQRLRLTGRPSLERLCNCRGDCSTG